MPDPNLTVKVDADTEEAVESIEEVTEAVEELEAALESLQSDGVDIDVNAAVERTNRETRRNQGQPQ